MTLKVETDTTYATCEKTETFILFNTTVNSCCFTLIKNRPGSPGAFDNNLAFI